MSSVQDTIFRKKFNDKYELVADTYWQRSAVDLPNGKLGNLFALMFTIEDSDGNVVLDDFGEDEDISGNEKLSKKALEKKLKPMFDKVYKKLYSKWSKKK